MSFSEDRAGKSAERGTAVTYSGPRFALGHDDREFCIWDRAAPGRPILRFPWTEEGWARAWEEFTHLEEGETIQTVEAELAGQGPPGMPAGSIRTDRKAIGSIVLGLLGVVPVGVFSIAAFVLAIRARRRIERGGSRGAAAATVGMILGLLGMGWSAAVATGFIAINSCGFLDIRPDAPSWCDSAPAYLAIWGGVWVGELLLAARIGPMSARRWRETGVAMGVILVLVALAVLLPVVIERNNSNRRTSVPIETPGTGPVPFRPLPSLRSIAISDDFSDPSSGWGQETGDSFALGYVHGEYRIAESEPQAFRYWVHGTRETFNAVRVAVDVRRASGTVGRFGVLCEANGHAQEGYVFLIDPELGRFEVWVLYGGYPHILQAGQSGAIRLGSRTNSLEGYCDHRVANAPAVVTFLVNGVLVFQGQDTTLSNFTGVGMYAASVYTRIDARFDNLVMSV